MKATRAMKGASIEGAWKQRRGKAVHVWANIMNAELALARCELDGVMQGLSEGLEITDLQRNLIRLNVAGATLLGHPGETHGPEALPHLIDSFETFYPDGMPMPVEELPFARVLRGEPLSNYIVRLHRRDTGKRLVLSYDGSLIRDEGGTPVRVLLTFREITEQIHASEARSDGEGRARILGESVPYGVWWSNVHGGAEYLSRSFLDLLEMTEEEAKEFGWTRRMRPEAVEPMMTLWRHCLETGDDWEYEHDLLGPDGKYHTVLARGTAVRDAAGAIVGWSGINLDFDKRRALEEALRESEERYRILADHSPVMIWVTNIRGGLEMVNSAYEDFFGMTEAQVRGRGAWEPLVHPDDTKGYVEKFMISLRDQKPFEAEARVCNKNAEWRWLRSNGVPRLSSSGEFVGIAGTSADITDQKRAAENLKQTSANLRLMVTHASEAMVIVNGTGVIEATSESGAHMLGFTEEELVGKSVEDLAEPFSRLERAMRLQDLQQHSKSPVVSTLRVRTKSGTLQWVTVIVTMIHQRGPGVKALVKLQRLDLTPRCAPETRSVAYC